MAGALDYAWKKPRLEWGKGDPAPVFPFAPTAQLSEMFIPCSCPADLQS